MQSYLRVWIIVVKDTRTLIFVAILKLFFVIHNPSSMRTEDIFEGFCGIRLKIFRPGQGSVYNKNSFAFNVNTNLFCFELQYKLMGIAIVPFVCILYYLFKFEFLFELLILY